MGGKILSAAILIASVTPASAQLGKDASYFCVVEAVGGLAYDERTKKWIGSSFRADKKFVLRLKYLRTRAQKSYSGDDEMVYDYTVMLTNAGSNSPYECIGDGQKHVTVHNLNSVWCHALDLHEYRFNLITNRFVSTYLFGYTNGENNNDNTPAVLGGTCTKID